MAYALGKKSTAELQGVHPTLVRIVQRAIVLTVQDFSVHDGVRTLEEQREYVRRGVSKTMNSRHLPQADGHSHAVDLVPYINGQLRWEWGPIYNIAHAVDQAATELGVKLRWGAVWDRTMDQYGGSAAALKAEVEAYCRRHPGPDFIDGPHFELA
jgi:peptidoglycan L-alanyl-D-glutamate endopeptidase CwlK